MEQTIHYFVLDLPHSDACFVKAYPAETTEAFCDGHVSAFSFLGGVPRSILYDNTRLAVARILGDGRRQAYSCVLGARDAPIEVKPWFELFGLRSAGRKKTSRAT